MYKYSNYQTVSPRTFVFAWVILGILSNVLIAQTCPSPLLWQPVQRNNTIEWSKFPAFSLPFTVVYEGPRFDDTQSQPLQRGFSHLANFSGNEPATLPASKRALTWYHIATAPTPSQPWAERNLESPWNNDLNLYRQTWNGQLAAMANIFNDSRGRNTPNIDILSLDIERILDTDREILGIKSNARVPQNYRQLSDSQFLERYKRDIQKIYAAPVAQAQARGLNSSTKISSYSDAPIRGNFNNWLALKATVWKDWTTDVSPVLHLVRDTLSNKIGGGFYNQLQFLSPSCYYYYAYENPLGKDYLAYLLFVIEANRHWSDRPVVPYVWLRYHDYFNPSTPFVPNFVAEATAIFPFFSGAKGLWLWDSPTLIAQQHNYATYEHFVAGLYRLSLFKDFFEGAYELVIPKPAIESAASNSPIWRGVVKGNDILIAAQNPYAISDTETKDVIVTYKNWQRSIQLKGREVFLCKFDRTLVSSIAPVTAYNLVVFPNPATDLSAGQLLYQFEQADKGIAEVSVADTQGYVRASETLSEATGTRRGRISTAYLPTGTYIFTVKTKNATLSQKIVVK